MITVWVGPLEATFENWLIDHHLDVWEEWADIPYPCWELWDWAEEEYPDVLSEFKQLCNQEESNDQA